MSTGTTASSTPSYRSPGDLPGWGIAAEAAYGARPLQLPCGARLYRRDGRLSRYLTNAPYCAESWLEPGELTSADVAHALAARGGEVFLRTRNTRFTLRPPTGVRVRRLEGYYSFSLRLPTDPDEFLTRGMDAKLRNVLRKGLRGGFHFELGREDLLRDFHRLLARCWTELGTPTHSEAFIAALLRSLPQSWLLLAYDRGEAVSGALLVIEGEAIHHPFAFTAARAKPSGVNTLTHWEIIKLGIARGCGWFDLGRSHQTQGTFAFKRSWRATPYPLLHLVLSRGDPSDPLCRSGRLMRLATAAWTRLPPRVAARIGPLLIRDRP